MHDNWDAIVLGGAFGSRGMAGFADLLSPQESRAIHAYVVDRTLADPTLLETLHDWARRNLCVPHTWLAD